MYSCTAINARDALGYRYRHAMMLDDEEAQPATVLTQEECDTAFLYECIVTTSGINPTMPAHRVGMHGQDGSSFTVEGFDE